MANPIIATRDYFQHSFAELKKVAWPSREMTIRYSSLVLAVSILMAGFFAALDAGLQTAVNAGLSRTPSSQSSSASAPIPDVTPSVQATDENGQNVKVDAQPASPTDVAPKPSTGGITLPPIDTSKK